MPQCQPLFDAIGQRTFVVGDKPSAANLVKLSGNFLLAAMIECLGEAFALVRKGGVDPHAYLEILTNTLFSAPAYKTYGTIIADQKYEPAGFAMSLGLKDIRLALAAADALATPMPVASLVHDHFLSGVAQGAGQFRLVRLGASRRRKRRSLSESWRGCPGRGRVAEYAESRPLRLDGICRMPRPVTCNDRPREQGFGRSMAGVILRASTLPGLFETGTWGSFPWAPQSSANVGQEAGLAGDPAAIGECAMVRLRHIAIVAAACAGLRCRFWPTIKNRSRQNRPNTPRLNNIMMLTQLGHFKLWYAGIVQNWPLANYELEQIRASISIAKTLYPNNPKSNMKMMTPAADDLDDAIKAKDSAKFSKAFSKLTAACNSCHEATGFSFIKIREPRLSPLETSPFSNETFPTK